jgi:hypothetical protein
MVELVMSTIIAPLLGPGQVRPNLMHMRQCGSVASHFMRFLRHIAQALVLAGIFQGGLMVLRSADVFQDLTIGGET